MTEFLEFFKNAIRHDTGLGDIILHIHGGLLILMIARVAFARGLGTFIPFSVVLALEILNEVADRLHYGAWRWEDTTGDLINTLFWPFVISMGVRLRPMIRKSDADEALPHVDAGLRRSRTGLTIELVLAFILGVAATLLAAGLWFLLSAHNG